MTYTQRCLNYFQEICRIPHCSFHTQDMFEYLCATLTRNHYEIKTDEAKNIYAKKGNPKICLQSHYDMVCVGDSMQQQGVQSFEKDGFLYAQNSSLGADNGIGMACMLALEHPDLELLFTNDEEVGMIGANALSLEICSPLLLNLDSEDISEIVVGCAGGADIECHIDLKPFLTPLSEITKTHPYAYAITAQGFSGGHSGLEIHKNKENAIVELGILLSTLDAYIIKINAGEKRNSIPVGVDSIILCSSALASHYTTPNGASFQFEQIHNLGDCESAYHKNAIVPLLCGIHSGVYATSAQGVLSSLNLSLLTQENQNLNLMMMARANTPTLLERSINRLALLAPLLNAHCSLQTSDFYAPWEKSIEDSHPALGLLLALYEEHSLTPQITQIHAGLECGILKRQILKHSKIQNLDVISIGPTIHAPHSIKECLDLKSFEQFTQILKSFVERYGH